MDEKILSIVLQARDEASKVIGDVTENLRSSGKEAEDSSGRFKAAGAAIAVAGAGVTVYAEKAKDAVVNLAGETNKLSRETGVSTEKAGELIYAAQRMGLSADAASTTFGIFSKRIAESTDNTNANVLASQKLQVQIQGTQKDIAETTDNMNKNGDASGDLRQKLNELNVKLREEQDALSKVGGPLEKIGVSTVDAAGKTKDFNTILLETADRFKEMPNGAEKTALAMQLFGRSGKDLLPLLNQGADGMQKLEDRAKELGLTLSGDNLAKVKNYVQAQKDLKDSNQALQLTIGEKVIPIQTELTKKTNDMVQALLKAPGPIKDITATAIAFGGPAATAAGGILTFGANATTAAQGLGKMKGELSAVQLLARGGIVVAIAVVGAEALKSIAGIIQQLKDQKKAEEDLNSTNKAFTEQMNQASFAASALREKGLIPQAQAMEKNIQESQKARDEYAAHVESYRGMGGAVNQVNDAITGKFHDTRLQVEDNVDQMRNSLYDGLIRMKIFSRQLAIETANSIVEPFAGVAGQVEANLRGVAGAVARALQPAIGAAQIQGAAAGAAFQNAFNSQAGNIGAGGLQGAGGGLQGFSGGYIGGFAVGGFVSQIAAIAQGRDRQLAAVAPGEYVVTPEQQTNFAEFMNMLRAGVPQPTQGGGSGGDINITIQAGTILASNDEVRSFAERIYASFRDIARKNGKLDNLPNIGVSPV
jgi:hypothetical protein